MSTHAGYILNDLFLLLLPVPTLPDTPVADFSLGVLPDSLILTGEKTNVASAQPVDTKSSLNLLPDYFDQWYNHLHILPSVINVGNLTSQQVRPIEIFNGFFEQRTLESVAATDLSGIIFDVDTPVDIAPLASIIRNLVIDTTGAPQFDGYFTLSFDNADYFLFVSGKRVLIMPFHHNWNNPVTERLSYYNTNAISENGIEQIVNWRDYARRTLDYQFLLASTQTNAKRLRALWKALIYGWQNRIYAVPIWTDATRLQAAAVSGTDQVTVATTNFDYDIGSYVMLWQNEEKYELVEILEVHSTYLKLAVNLVNSWQPIRTVVMPARLAYIASKLSGSKETVDVDIVPCSFEFLAQFPNINRLATISEVTYRSAPVLFTKNDYDQNPSFDIERAIIRNDNNIGIFSLTAEHPAPQESGSFLFLFANHANIAAFYAWLHNRKGRFSFFWLPTWSNDFEAVQDISGTSANIQIKSINYSSLYYINGAPAFNRRDIMLRLKNGTYYFRRITSATLNDDDTEMLALDSNFGVTIPISTIDRICFLIPSALSADTTEIAWQSGNVSKSQVTFNDIYDNEL